MKPIVWSPSRYDVANTCLMKYYFQYVRREKVDISPEQALGIFLHKRKERLFKGYPGSLEIKYKSAESFANFSIGLWKHEVIRTNEIQGKKIVWKFKGQEYATLKDIEELCIKTYNKCVNEEPPLYVEYERKFQLNEIYFDVIIDEIRKNYTIRDYKTGLSMPKEFQMNHFPQLTFYALAFGCFAHNDKEFARICEVKEEDAKSFGGNPDFINEKINLEYYNVKEDKVISTKRNNSDYFQLESSLISLEDDIRNLDSKIRANYGKHCNYCIYQQICDKEAKGILSFKENLDNQLILFPVKIKTKFKNKTLRLFPRGKVKS